MPILVTSEIRIRPIVAETGPIGMGKPTPSIPTTPKVGAEFIARHKIFIEEVVALNHCFTRSEIVRFTPEEVEGHIQVALQDNFIIEDGKTGRFCTGQVAWRLKELTKGYVYERL